MLRLPDHWVWDSWHAHDGAEHHLFFLRASRALLDPDRRHDRASIGHATSNDLRHWELQPDALVHSDPAAWDDRALWTGSVVRRPDGQWRMFFTAISHADQGRVQRIGTAVSDDLCPWSWSGDNPLLEADPRWYVSLNLLRRLGPRRRGATRMLLADPGGDGWQIRRRSRPARARGAPEDGAWSATPAARTSCGGRCSRR